MISPLNSMIIFWVLVQKGQKQLKKKDGKMDFLEIWEEDSKGQQEKYAAARLKYASQTNEKLLEQRDKDRLVELQKIEIECICAENEKNIILIHQYEIAASLGKPIEEVFPGALCTTRTSTSTTQQNSIQSGQLSRVFNQKTILAPASDTQ